MAQLCRNSPCETDDLFARARDGDGAAWHLLVKECSPKLLRVVRRKLAPRMRSLYDSTDFVNDVFKSLVAKSDRFDFPNLAALEKYLMQAAEQKVVDEYRRQHRRKRDIDRNRRLDDQHDGEFGFDPPASDPTPSQFAQAQETHEELLAASDGPDRTVIQLKALEYSNEEVAEQTGLHVRRVQRFLKRMFDSKFAPPRG